jgi:hypothetical protein
MARAAAMARAIEDQTWVERLKSTPAARLESGLPKKAFDQWLAELTKTQPKLRTE